MTKVGNAQATGAIGVVVFNEGQPGRDGPIAGTLGDPVAIPAIGASYALGADTVTRIRDGDQTVVFHITTNAISEERTTYSRPAGSSVVG